MHGCHLGVISDSRLHNTVHLVVIDFAIKSLSCQVLDSYAPLEPTHTGSLSNYTYCTLQWPHCVVNGGIGVQQGEVLEINFAYIYHPPITISTCT